MDAIENTVIISSVQRMLHLFKVNFEFNNYIEFKSKTEKEILGVVIRGIKEHGFEKIKCIAS